MPDKIDLKKLKIVPENEIVFKSENEAFIKRILELLLAKDKRKDATKEALKQAVSQILIKIESKFDISLTDLRKQVNKVFVENKKKEISDEQKQLFSSLKSEIGKTFNKKLEETIEEIKSNIKPGPMGMRGESGRPPTEEEIQLAFSPVVDEFRKSWEEKVQQTMMRRGVGTGGGKQIRMSSFEFTGDGSTTAFTLPRQPGAKGKAIWAYLNGQQIQLGTHFTVGRKTLNTTFTPANGDTIEGYLID